MADPSHPKPTLTLIAAMDENRLLAGEQGIPWHLTHDIAHFRDYTAGRWLLLGRKTYEEMHGWFRAGHFPLVLSSRCGWDPDPGCIVSSVPHALALAGTAGQFELICCGGAQTYAAALPYAERLVLTIVHHRFDAGSRGVFFPEWRSPEWRETSGSYFPKDAKNRFDFTIQHWQR